MKYELAGMGAPYRRLSTPRSRAFETPEEEDFDIGRYLEVLQSNKWLIAGIALVVFVAGFIYAFLEKPVYESAMVIQVENSEGGGGGKGALAEAGGLVDVRAPASAEFTPVRTFDAAAQDQLRAYADQWARLVARPW